MRADEEFRRTLYLETSAQIHRLFGPPAIVEDIVDIVRRFERCGTTRFVIGEFEHTILALYRRLAEVLRRHERVRVAAEFDGIWRDALSRMGPIVPGGPKVLAAFSARMGATFGGGRTTPLALAHFVEGQRAWAAELFYFVNGSDLRRGPAIADRSECCLWKGFSGARCDGEFDERCMLKSLCAGGRTEFLRSVEVVAGGRFEESAWMKGRVGLLRKLGTFELATEMGAHPGKYGDCIIFCEIPPKSAMLTSDKVFRALATGISGREVAVFHVRPARRTVRGRCVIKKRGKGPIVGVAMNRSARHDVRMRVVLEDGKSLRGQVTVEFEDGQGEQPGRVVLCEAMGPAAEVVVRLR